MNIPENLKYTKTHEWVKINGSTGRIGITDFAQHELTDIVFVELPKMGIELIRGKTCAVLESVKTAGDIYAPLSGKVTGLNEHVTEAPELVNTDPYGDGWLFELEIQPPDELETLLTPGEYRELTGER